MNPFAERWPTAYMVAAAIALLWTGLALAARARRLPLVGEVARWLGLLCLGLGVVHVLLWDSFAGASYGLLAVIHLGQRLPEFVDLTLALGVAAGIYHHFRQNPAIVTGLVVGANLMLLWYITIAILLLLDGRVNGRIAGNQAMMVAAAWALYGFGLFLVERRFPDQRLRHGIRFLLVAALGYLVVAAMPGNARWAVLWVRLLAYGAVLGTIGGVELAYRRYGSDGETNGLLAFAAAAAGFFIINFETERWLEPLFTLPAGQWLSVEGLRWEESTLSFTRIALWAGYTLVLLWAGDRLRSVSTRRLAWGLYALVVAAVAIALPDATAALWLRLLASALVCLVPARALLRLRRSRGRSVTGPPVGWQ